MARYPSKTMTLHLHDEVIHYIVEKRPRRKRIALQIKDATLYVLLPKEAPFHLAATIVRDHKPWIKQQLQRAKEKMTQVPPLSFRTGERLFFFGLSYPLLVLRGNYRAFSMIDGEFHATIRSTDDTSIIRTLYRQWVEKEATAWLYDTIRTLSTILGVAPVKLSLREQKRRWGTCTSKGHILLNWRIFLAPPSVARSVIAHELAHLRWMDHSPRFYATLTQLDPTYKKSDWWLSRYGHLLYRSAK